MTARSKPVEITEQQASAFRDRRAHLTPPGARDAVAAARAILGAQAQQEAPALFALSLRTEGRPTASDLRRQLLEEGARRLVRTWGQRDTLHVFDPEDWRLVVTARAEWPQSGRRGAMPNEPELAATRRAFAHAKGPLMRRDLFEIVPQRFIDEVAAHPGVAATGDSAVRFAASRLIWRLALAGEVCFAEKRGSEQSYVHRDLWFPDLASSAAKSPADAATALARRYLRVHGPATAADLAHFFGARVGSARGWLERLGAEIRPIACGSREGLVAHREDLTDLLQPVPRGSAAWPVRLLPKWDTHLMRHADKSWLMPEPAERPLVWKKAADIAATVVARGRVVATWSHRATRRLVLVRVSPLSAWRAGHLAGVKREAAALAAHLERPGVEVEVVR